MLYVNLRIAYIQHSIDKCRFFKVFYIQQEDIRPETQKGFVPIKWRWVVERTFGWFNCFRRLSKEVEKTTQSARTMILLANCQIIINRIQ